MKPRKDSSRVALSMFAAIALTGQVPATSVGNEAAVAAHSGGSKIQGKKVPPDEWLGDPSWSPDGAYVAVKPSQPGNTFSTDGKIHFGDRTVWEANTVILRSSDYSQLSTIGEVFPKFSPTWSPSCKFLAAGAWDHSLVSVYDAGTGTLVKKIKVLPPESYAWSPDGNRLLVSQRESISICDFDKNLETKISVPSDENNFQHAIWSPDGKSIAAVGSKKTDEFQTIIRIWNAQSGAEITKIEINGLIGKVSWSLDGRSFLYSRLAEIVCLDLASNKITSSIKTRERVRFLAWSPKKKQLIYKDCDTIHLLDAQTLTENIKIQGPMNGFFVPSMSPDEQLLAINSVDTVALCDAKTGVYLGYKTLRDFSRIQWSPDGNSLAVSWHNSPPTFEPVRLSTVQEKVTVFNGGKVGAPNWSKFASPKNLEECFAEFGKKLSKEGLERFKNTPEDRLYDFGGGSLISDTLMADVYGEWGIHWGSCELDAWFERYGITEPKDVVDIVLVSYWRHLNSRPIEFDQQVEKHKAWWESERKAFSTETR